MRLSEWAKVAPHRDSMSSKVLGVLEPVLMTLGAEQDPHGWIFWGDDPTFRYLLVVATPPGLIAANVRVNVPQEGPRVAAKVIRWSRVQVGDLSLETAPGGHQILSATLEGNVFRATDSAVGQAAAFVLAVLAGIDGRPLPDLDAVGVRRIRRASGRSSLARGASAGPAAAKRPSRPIAKRSGSG